jgi:co-chaperonin GroES (HSP10)
MPLKMLGRDLAIIPIEDPDRIGHIIIPEEAKQRADQGVVKYKGPDVRFLSVGDHVLFSGYTGEKVSLNDEGVLIVMSEEDVLAVLGEPEPWILLSRLEDLVHSFIVEHAQKGTVVDDVDAFMMNFLARIKDIPYSEGFEF